MRGTSRHLCTVISDLCSLLASRLRCWHSRRRLWHRAPAPRLCPVSEPRAVLSESGKPGAEHGSHAATYCVSPRQLSQRHCERESLCRCAQIRPSSVHCAFASCPPKLVDSVREMTLAVSQSPRLSFCDFADAGLVTDQIRCVYTFSPAAGALSRNLPRRFLMLLRSIPVYSHISKSAKHNPYSAVGLCISRSVPSSKCGIHSMPRSIYVK